MIPRHMEGKAQTTCRDRDAGTAQETLAVLRNEDDAAREGLLLGGGTNSRLDRGHHYSLVDVVGATFVCTW